MKPKLETTVLFVKDLADQPISKAITVVSAGGMDIALTCDRVLTEDQVIHVFQGPEEIAAFPCTASWIVIAAGRTYAHTYDEVLAAREQDRKALFPYQQRAQEELAAVISPGGTNSKAEKTDNENPSAGFYM